ncbi:MAG: sigma-70 family RNA polymerase sigma factor [Pirellulales bacterium]|nr:sigma-70 family RNA polymerase sigma factor [Pirellulales bacterium]
MNSQTEPTFLDRLRDGADPLAWDEFFERYGRMVFAFARRRGCAEDTAEEIVQEVMLAVFQQRNVFRYDPSRGRFRDWLGAVVRNQVARRRRRPERRIRPGASDRPPEPADDAPDAEAAWQAAFEEALLGVLLDVVRQEVNPRTYQAFELTAFEGLSGREASRVTGLSTNAVYLARRAVTRRLAQLAGGYRDDGRLGARLREALGDGPSPRAQRALTERLTGGRGAGGGPAS